MIEVSIPPPMSDGSIQPLVSEGSFSPPVSEGSISPSADDRLSRASGGSLEWLQGQCRTRPSGHQDPESSGRSQVAADRQTSGLIVAL